MRLIAILSSVVFTVSLLWSSQAAADASVTTRLEARGISWEVDEDGDYRVLYRYSDVDRSQLVFVSGRTESLGGFTVREVFAPAAQLSRDGVDGARALALLADSRARKLGAWEIQGDHLYYVIKLPDNVDAAQLESAMDVAAKIADDKEIEFSGDLDAL